MLNPDSELIFSIRILPSICSLRGEQWKCLCESVLANPKDIVKSVGMILLVAKIAGCIKCNSDSYRAIRGCSQCAKQAIRRYKGTDKDLEIHFAKYMMRAKNYLERENII